jgi:single-strand DNA-binding protein
MIKIFISGNIGKDAEVKTMQSGDSVISFSVAHTERTKDSNGNPKENTTWVNCSKWVKKDASTKIADYLKKGTKVIIEGTPNARAYTTVGSSDAKASLECRVLNIELIGSASSNTDTNKVEENKEEEYKDDLPF